LKRDKGLSLLVVDYLQLITARGRFNSRQEEWRAISRGLKGCEGVADSRAVLSQLTRAPEREERGRSFPICAIGAIETGRDW